MACDYLPRSEGVRLMALITSLITSLMASLIRYLRAHYPSGIELETVYVKRELVEAVEAELEEACGNHWAVDITAGFEAPLSEEDVMLLMSSSMPVIACD